jgi:hypothetical protein
VLFNNLFQVNNTTTKTFSITYQTGEHLHGFPLVETDDLIPRELEAKVRRQSHQRIAISLQRVKETRARLVHNRISNSGKDPAICSLLAATMRCSEEDYPDRLLTNIFVSWLDARLEKCLKCQSGICRSILTGNYENTCLTTIPPREWAIKMMGLSASYNLLSARHVP